MPSSDPSPAPAPFHVGQIIAGVYEIIALLGVGGMGAVYEARDTTLNRHVAIKAALGPHGAALINEARALAVVRHPALLTVHGAGREQDVDYFVAELVRGETLEHLIDTTARSGHPLAVDEALDVLVAIADGLCALHGAGMAHRDLKPANVILGAGRVVLIDLGLFVPEFGVSAENEVAGSLEYMAPEVLRRTVEPGDGPRIDLYALGIIAFELLTGRSPFFDTTAAKVLAKQLLEPIPDVRTRRPEVPPRLAALVAELTAKEANDRPPSSEAVLWQLTSLRGRHHADDHAMNVLVVDDDPDVGALLARALESMLPGVTVHRTTDPIEALATIERAPPDVVAVDLNMPTMNGVEVCMRIDGLPESRRPAVVAMSAHSTKADTLVLRTLGVAHVVSKDYRFVGTVCDVVRSIRQARDEQPRSVRPSSRYRRT